MGVTWTATTAASCARSARRWPSCAARPARRLARRHGDAAAGQDGHVDAAQGREVRAGAGGGAEGRPDRPDAPADPGLLAGRARAPDHLGPGRHQGPVRTREDDFNLGIYRMQVLGKDQAIMRWLAHRGGAQHYARWTRRRRAGAPALRRRARRRSRHHPGRRDAGAGHPVGIPVRRPAARPQGRAGALQDRAADGPGQRRDRAGRPRPARRARATRGPTATTPATTTRSRPSRSSRSPPSPCAATRSI